MTQNVVGAASGVEQRGDHLLGEGFAGVGGRGGGAEQFAHPVVEVPVAVFDEAVGVEQQGGAGFEAVPAERERRIGDGAEQGSEHVPRLPVTTSGPGWPALANTSSPVPTSSTA